MESPVHEDVLSDKGFYVGVQDEEDDPVDISDDELNIIWEEMAMAMETSKGVSLVPDEEQPQKKDDHCDHAFIFKDDLGEVCRICGLIGRAVDTIIKFKYKVKRSTRTYVSDSWNAKEKDAFGIKIVENDLLVTDNISAHPRI